jgi:hypothetical protein
MENPQQHLQKLCSVRKKEKQMKKKAEEHAKGHGTGNQIIQTRTLLILYFSQEIILCLGTDMYISFSGQRKGEKTRIS